MKKRFCMLMIVLSLLGIISTEARAVILEVLTVDADGTPATSSFALEIGQAYTFIAEGTYHYATDYLYPNVLADAEWMVIDNDHPDEWYEYHPNIINEDDDQLDIMVNDQFVNWLGSPLADPDPITDIATFAEHTFSQSHRYLLNFPGNGSAVEFRITDFFGGPQYSDNSGSLTVTIIPEPSTICLFALGGLLLRRKKNTQALTLSFFPLRQTEKQKGCC